MLRWISRILRALLVLALVGALAAAGALWLVVRELERGLPDLRRLEDYEPPLTTRIFARDGRLIGELFEERRLLVPASEIPEIVKLAFVAGEDDAFFQHSGLDWMSIARAAWVNLRAGGKVRQGGSTITQQVAKSLLSSERSLLRKAKDMLLAKRIEERFGKEEILWLYLNQIYLGHGAYGVGEAARTYFGKPLAVLDAGEAALLAGLPKAPTDFSPYVSPRAAEERRQYVLQRMLEVGYVDAETYRRHATAPPRLAPPPERADQLTAGYFTEEVRRLLYERLGRETTLRGGLVVETTLDLERQRAAIESLRDGLEALDRRTRGGWRGPLRRVRADAIEAELATLARENELGAVAVGAHVPLLPLRHYTGVVRAIDVQKGEARIALAPGHDRVLALADASIALKRPASLAKDAPLPPSAIASALAVGDVVRVRLARARDASSTGTAEHEGETAAASEVPGERETATASDAAGEPPPSSAAPSIAEERLALVQEPKVEGAVVALDAASGDVTALVGGWDFQRSEFDRATQARRQPGSSFKPFVYGAALERGWTPTSIVVDAPVSVIDPGSGQLWQPENYTKRFLGAIPAREALARSLNNATIRLYMDVGIDATIEYARRLGIRSPLGRHLSLALGSTEVSLLELVGSYATIAAGGRQLAPRFVVRVLDRHGAVLMENVPLGDVSSPAAPETPRRSLEPAFEAPAVSAPGAPRQAVSPANAYLLTSLLRATIEESYGTGHRAAALGRPLAGKTGTTNDQKDAWFVGFSPELVAGVWVGYDEREVLGKGETGGHAALPIWIDFIKVALAGVPAHDFAVPEGIVFARVGRASGLPTSGDDPSSYFQPYAEGALPSSDSPGDEGESEGGYDPLRDDAF